MDDNLPDLVRDYKLATLFDKGYTIHKFDDPDAPPFSPQRLEHWKRSRTLGHGAQGRVVLQTCTSGGRSCTKRAVKIVQLQDGGTRRRYIRELETIIKFSHDKYARYFVKTLGWYESQDSLCIAMEYFPAGDLQTYIRKHDRLLEDDCRQIASQLLRGLAAMHHERFAHRDVKPQDVLIQQCPQSEPRGSWWVKLADFGISKKLGGDTSSSTRGIGTPHYMAPELCRWASVSDINYQMADMWALGVTTFFILTKTLPFQEPDSDIGYERNPDSFPRDPLDDCQVSMDGLAFIRALMTLQPKERLVSDAAMRHAWIIPILDVHSGSSESPSGRSSFGGETGMATEISDSTSQQYLRLPSPSAAWTDEVLDNPRSAFHINACDNPYYKQTNVAQRARLDASMVVGLVHERGLQGRNLGNWEARTIHEAAKDGLVEVINQLLKNGADVTSRDDNGWTLVNSAARNGHVEVVKLLLENGANATTPSNNGWTPMHSAASNGHVDVARVLVEKGANLKAKSKDGNTPLSYAAMKGHEAVTRLLVEKGADLEAKDKDGDTPLLLAAIYRHEAVTRLLVEKGADLEAKSNNGNTPLSRAALNGQEAAARLLVEKGADLEAKSNSGNTPLLQAALNGQEAVARLLVEKGANIEAKNNNGNTPLSRAAFNGHEAVIKLLAEQGADLEGKSNSGNTPLSWAVTKGHEAVARLLLENGANLEAKDKNGNTPLLWAVIKEDKAMVKLLLEKGADIEWRNNSGNTPLSRATYNRHEAVAKLLLEKGANLEGKSKDGDTPLSWAAIKGHESLVRLLMEKGANIEAKNNNGNTPLLWAVTMGHEAITRLLVEKGANIEAKNKDGSTPLFLAAQNKFKAVEMLLLEKGARKGLRYRSLIANR